MQNKLKRTAPYNTGKIKIGCHYVPPMQNHMDSNDEFWQDVLTGVHQTRHRNKMQFIWYVVALVVIFAGLVVTA